MKKLDLDMELEGFKSFAGQFKKNLFKNSRIARMKLKKKCIEKTRFMRFSSAEARTNYIKKCMGILPLNDINFDEFNADGDRKGVKKHIERIALKKGISLDEAKRFFYDRKDAKSKGIKLPFHIWKKKFQNFSSAKMPRGMFTKYSKPPQNKKEAALRLSPLPSYQMGQGTLTSNLPPFEIKKSCFDKANESAFLNSNPDAKKRFIDNCLKTETKDTAEVELKKEVALAEQVKEDVKNNGGGGKTKIIVIVGISIIALFLGYKLLYKKK